MSPDDEIASGVHVLVADDQADVGFALRDALQVADGRGPDVRVSLVGSGALALDTLAAERVDIAVLDVRMSGGGAALVSAVRHGWPGTTIVSTSTHPGERDRMLAAGATHFVEKSLVAELVHDLLSATPCPG